MGVRTHGVQRITIAHQQLGILRNYAFPISIQTATVYEMVLTTARVTTIVEEEVIPTQWLVITSEPDGADVYINDQLRGPTPFAMEFKVGQYSYRVEKLLYHPEAGRVTITADKRESMSLKLRPNFGYIRVSTAPESGATVTVNGSPLPSTSPVTTEMLKSGTYTVEVNKQLFHNATQQVTVTDGKTTDVSLAMRPAFGGVSLTTTPETGAEVLLNGNPTGKTTPTTLERLPRGEHTITVRKEWYQPQTQRITLDEGDSKQLSIAMQPTFGNVKITAEADATIYVANERKANGSWEGRLVAGWYTIEARKEKYTTDTQRLQVELGQTHNLSLHPKPMQGELKVVTTPFDARITLNGKDHGTTPTTLRNLLVGDYTLTLTKQGHGTVTKTITIAEGKTTEVNETLPTGMEVTIASTPSGAQLWVGGISVGTTPYKATLAFGSHTVKLVNGKKVVDETINVAQGGKTRWEYNVAEFEEPEMVFVKGGKFTMGCTSEQGSDCYDSEKPSHTVTVSDFYIGKYEVTQTQWRAVMGSNPSRFSGCDNCLVENVSWNDVQEFIKKLNQLTGKKYRLPTEAEWEYAARGGSQSKGYKYSGSNSINEVAWYTSNSGSKTKPVGGKKPNELGLYDISGNVWEWCQDWYGSYTRSNKTNPTGPSSGSYRVLRGGSWSNIPRNCRVSSRNSYTPAYRYINLGFRVVLVPG